MNIVFLGTPNIAAASLQALLQAKHNIIACYTQPDKKAGRGRKLTFSPVKQLALVNNIKVLQPKSLKQATSQEELASLKPDLGIVVAYGKILPLEILKIPTAGFINVHYSLLPKSRGASPICHSILTGERETGVSIMQLDEQLDHGPLLYQKKCLITPEDTSSTLEEKLIPLANQALVDVLSNFTTYQNNMAHQDHNSATFCSKISKQDGIIKWDENAEIITRKIRAFSPWPLCVTTLGDMAIKVLSAHVVPLTTDVTPGTIVELTKNEIVVATGKNGIAITKLQFPGKKAISSKDALNAKLDLFTQTKFFN